MVNKRVDWYGLPKSLTGKLRSLGVDRFDDLFQIRPQEIFDAPEIGPKTLAKILRKMADRAESL